MSGSMLQAQDSKMAGEAATQPSVRLPPLREGRLPKLMQAALACRVQGEALPDTDLAILLDGGREGSWVVEGSSHAICSLLSWGFTSIHLGGVQSSLLGSMKDPDGGNIKKEKIVLTIHHDESSIRARRKRDRGHHVMNSERIYIVTSEEVLAPYRDRAHFPGTTRGEMIGPASAPSWEAWV